MAQIYEKQNDVYGENIKAKRSAMSCGTSHFSFGVNPRADGAVFQRKARTYAEMFLGKGELKERDSNSGKHSVPSN